MSRKRFPFKGLWILALSAALLLAAFPCGVSAETAPGEYTLKAALSCYVTAMGGVEFGAPLLIQTQLLVDADGGESLKLTFSKNSVTIYSVTCDTFVDAAPSYVTEDRGVRSGTIGIYDRNGVLQTEGVSYTLSEDTALNASNEAVHYVETITLPIDSRRDTYNLTLYINSNVMGVQFCNANDKATAATYSATLSVSWDSLSESGAAESGSGAESPAQTTPPETDTASGAAAEEMNGLTVYRVDGKEEAATEEAQSVVVRETRINTKGIVIILIVSAAIFAAGAVLYFTSRGKREDEE